MNWITEARESHQAITVPLAEQLRSVPRNAVLRIDTPNALGCMDTRSIPVGRLCHEAADALGVTSPQHRQEGFMEAFYEMAAMLGIEGAQAASPEQVYRDQVKPALEELKQRATNAEEAYLNMRQWAERNGLDTAARNAGVTAAPAAGPLRELGAYLSRVLDEDQWATAEALLLKAAAGVASGGEARLSRLAESIEQVIPDILKTHPEHHGVLKAVARELRAHGVARPGGKPKPHHTPMPDEGSEP